MNEEETVLDWSDQSITVERQGGKFYLNYWVRDSETGGYDVVRTQEFGSMYDALKGAIKWVDDEAASDV
jgi:hypothetical protein